MKKEAKEHIAKELAIAVAALENAGKVAYDNGGHRLGHWLNVVERDIRLKLDHMTATAV